MRPGPRPLLRVALMQGIVTGASRGLGLALTRALVERGWRLVVDARGEEALRRAVAGLDGVVALAGDVTDPDHRRRLVEAAGEPIDLLVNNASVLGPSPQPTLAHYPLDELRRVYEVNVLAPLALTQLALPHFGDDARVLNVTSDAAVEAYENWGGYGSSKAALAQITAVLGAETRGLRAYAVDPGDMRTQMQQEAFPGEDISDRPPPEESVPGLLALIEGDLPSGLLPRPRPDRGVGVSALAFDLPPRLEAHEPPEARGLKRDEVRLLVASRPDGSIVHSRFSELPQLVDPGRSDRPQHVGNPSGGASGDARGRNRARAEALDPGARPGSRPSLGRGAAPGRRAVRRGRRRRATRAPGRGDGANPGAVRRSAAVARRARPPHAARGVSRRARARHPIPPRTTQLAAVGVPERLRGRAGERGDAQRRPTLHPGADHRLVAAGVLVAPITLHTGVSSQERDEHPYPERFRVPARPRGW